MNFAQFRKSLLVTLVLGTAVVITPALLVARQEPGISKAAPPVSAPQSTKAQSLDRHGDPLPAGARIRLGTVRYRQNGSIGRIAYSPDGQFVVTDVGEQWLQVWDGREGKKLRQIVPGLDSVHDLKFSPDGKRLAALGFYFDREKRLTLNRVAFLDFASGRLLVKGDWSGPGDVSRLAYAPDGQAVATLSEDGTLRLWDTAAADELLALKLGERGSRGLAFSPKGNLLAAGIGDNTGSGSAVQIVDLNKGRGIRTLSKIAGETLELAFSPDGTTLATAAAGRDNAVTLREVASGRELRRLPVKGHYPTGLSYSPDGRVLAVADDSGGGSLWELASGHQLADFGGPLVGPGALAFSPDGKTIAFTGGSNVLHFWDIAERRDRLAIPEAHLAEVESAVFAGGGEVVVTGGDDSTARVWDLPQGRQRNVFQHGGRVRTLALSSDGKRLATGAVIPDQKVRVWNLETGQVEREWPALSNRVVHAIALRFTKDGQSVLACWSDGKIRKWDVRTGQEQEAVQPRFPQGMIGGSERNNASTAVFSTGQRLALITDSLMLHVTDLNDGSLLFKFDRADNVAFSPDGMTVAVARRGKPQEIKLADGGIRSDSRLSDFTLHLLDGSSGKQRIQCTIPQSYVAAIAFSPDGLTLAVSTIWDGPLETGSVHLYRVADGSEIMKLKTPSFCSQGLAFTPDGTGLLTGMRDSSVVIWDLSRKP
jgi:WD40 repeat protein